jgi:hypothetical protein
VTPRSQDPLAGTSWIHAFEEDTPEGEVYRPADDDVPLSRRPRRQLAFDEGGVARVSLPWPDDRLVDMTGSWSREGDEYVLRFGSTRGDGNEHVLQLSLRSATRLLVRR